MTKVTGQEASINRITQGDVDDFELYPKLNEYQRIATKSAIYPGKGTPLGLIYVALKGCGETGEFAEHVGKAMRDDNFTVVRDAGFDGESGLSMRVSVQPLTSERREKLILEIGDDLWYLAAKCNELGITLQYAARRNLQKLCKRTDEGTLRGSGDNR